MLDQPITPLDRAAMPDAIDLPTRGCMALRDGDAICLAGSCRQSTTVRTRTASAPPKAEVDLDNRLHRPPWQ
jgi:hypothetical protein